VIRLGGVWVFFFSSEKISGFLSKFGVV